MIGTLTGDIFAHKEELVITFQVIGTLTGDIFAHKEKFVVTFQDFSWIFMITTFNKHEVKNTRKC